MLTYRIVWLIIAMMAIAIIFNIIMILVDTLPFNLIQLGFLVINVWQFHSIIKNHKKRMKSITHENHEIEAIVASIWNIKIYKSKWWHARRTLYRSDSTSYFLYLPKFNSVWIKYTSGTFSIVDYPYWQIGMRSYAQIKICDPDYIQQIESHLKEYIIQKEKIYGI